MTLPLPLGALALLAPPGADAASTRLVNLHGPDIAIIAIYFAMVIGIGFYLKRYTKRGEDFFLAGREMTAWVAGLSFISANLGALELMGWAAASYQYGILAAHWYWIGAIPAMLFLGLVMMPFYYISKTHSVPGYLKLRYGEAARGLSAACFAVMTVLMSGVNMYAMALVMKVVLGWNIHFSIWVSSLTVGVYVALGGLFSAIFNEVLQFFLIWLGALLIPILGLIETGGWSGMVARIHQNFPAAGLHAPVADHGQLHRQSRWASTGPASSSAWAWSSPSATGRRTSWWCSASWPPRTSRAAKLAPIIGSYFKMAVPFIVILPGLLGLALLPIHLVPGKRDGARPAQLQRGLAADAGALLRPRPAGPGHHRADRRLHVRHGGQRQRLLHGLDLRSSIARSSGRTPPTHTM